MPTHDELGGPLGAMMRRLWEAACRDNPQRPSIRVEAGHFVMTVNGGDPGLLAMAAGVPDSAEQTIDDADPGSVAVTFRWLSHADAIFGADGLFAQHMPGYEVRTPQIHMARLVQRAIEMRDTAIIEAGTGTGKSLAYAAIALAMGLRMVISTSNKNLQMQLYNKDLPFLTQFYPATVSLAVGKSNYACRFKAEDQMAGLFHIDNEELRRWYLETDSGNTEEIDFAVDWHELANLTVDDNCARKHCPLYSSCFYYAAKAQRAEADVVITNHALLCQAQKLPFANLLPEPEVLVVDEAHTLPDYARRTLGAEMTLQGLSRTLAKAEDYDANTSMAQNALGELGQALVKRLASVQDAQVGIDDELPEAEALAPWLAEVANAVWDEECEATTPQEQAMANTAERLRNAAMNLRALSVAGNGADVRWLEPNDGNPKLVRQPHDVSRFMSLIYGTDGTIFTSATIAAPDMAHFLRTAGLDDALQMTAASPFNYEEQALLYVPNGTSPAPSDNEWRDWAVQELEELVLASKGGAFLLFTSYAMMRYAADRLRQTFEYRNWPVFVQGDLPKLETARRFADHGDAVLFATKSFFEGVSIEGGALRLVVVDKMPFEAPNPLNTAMEAALAAYARDTLGLPEGRAQWYPFDALRAPKMILELKQATGRLIRTRRDYGVMAVLDSRLRTARYGRKMALPALPPAPLVSKVAMVDAFFAEHRNGKPEPLPSDPVQLMKEVLTTL